HRTAPVLAADAHARAHLDRPGEASLLREVEHRFGLVGVIFGADPKVVGQLGRGDDFAGVHPVLGVEGALDRLEAGVDFGSEQLGVPETSSQPVAMLAAHRATVLEYEVGDFARDRLNLADALGRLDVDDWPDVQATDIGVSVASSGHALTRDNLAEPLIELG